MLDFLLYNYITTKELNALDVKLSVVRSEGRSAKLSTKARIEELEADLGRVALLARSLADLCLARGLVTREELAALLLQADLADGKRDERLQAKVVMPGESKPADPDPAEDPRARKSKMTRRRPYP